MKDGYFKLSLTLISIMAVIAGAYFFNAMIMAWNQDARAAENHQLYMKYLKLECEKLENEQPMPAEIKQ